MANKFWSAPEVAEVARPLIAEHHKHLLTNGVRVDFYFCSDPKKNKGKETLAYAHKITNLNAFLASEPQSAGKAETAPGVVTMIDEADVNEPDAFFVIVVWHSAWRFTLSEKQRVALVDHELCHCGIGENEEGGTVLAILPHDLEEFTAVVRRHGRWLGDVDAIIRAAEAGPQMTFREIAEMQTARQPVVLHSRGRKAA